MANRLRFLWANAIDDAASLDGSSIIATLPVENLQNEDINALWRSSSSTPWILADFGAQIEIGVVAFFRSNAVSGDLIRVRLSTADATGAAGDAYDSGSVAANAVFGAIGHFLTPPQTGRYLRVDFTQSSNAEAGRWVAGRVWEPSYDMSFGWEPLWNDPSRRTESLGQTTYIDRRLRQRGFAFTIRGLTTDEAMDEIHEINRLCGTSRDILVCRDYLSSEFGKVSIWGLLEHAVRYPQPHPDHFEAEFRIWERL